MINEDIIDITNPKQIGDPIITMISENLVIEIQNYTFRGEKYSDVVLINSSIDKQYFIGRFKDPQSQVKVLHNKDKILVYNDEYNINKRKDVIKSVLALYSIPDDTVYAETEKDALNIFDKNIDSSFLENGNRLLVETDIERKNKTLIRV